MNKQASKQGASLSAIISDYSKRKRASSASARVYERGNIFRLYLSADKAQALGLSLNKQGFISLNKLSASERERVREMVAQLQA